MKKKKVIATGTERQRLVQTERTCQMSLLIQNCPKHSFTLCLPLIFPFARPPPETAVLHHLIWFYTHRPNIAADMNRNEKYSTVFPQTPRVHSPQLFGHAVHWCEWTFITLYVQCSAWCFFFVCFFQDCRTKNRKKIPSHSLYHKAANVGVWPEILKKETAGRCHHLQITDDDERHI